MDEREGIVGPIGDELAVCRQRLAESSVLERQVAQQLQRVVAPRAAERLIDHPAEQRRIPTVRSLAIPALRQSDRVRLR